jgi:hypothetical protein
MSKFQDYNAIKRKFENEKCIEHPVQDEFVHTTNLKSIE